MNTTAFLLGLVVTLGFYYYTVRKERSRRREDADAASQDRPGRSGGEG